MLEESLPTSYRAWRWEGSADPQALRMQPVRTRVLEPGQVWVRNVVIGLNPVDWKVLDGSLTTWRPGHIPGVDGAGKVVAVGPGVSAAWLGCRVAYHTSLHGHGSFAEFTPVAARALLRLPEPIDFEVGASVPCPALTAWLAIEKMPIRADQPLLITGAGGAVGNYLVQLAGTRGFAVTAMAHRRHWDRLQALGAQKCISGPLVAGDSAVGASRRFYAAIDTIDEHHAERAAAQLIANGHLICIQGRVPHWPCAPFGLTLSMHEVALGALHIHGDDDAWWELTRAGERMLAEIAEGRLQPQARIVSGFEALAQRLDDLRHRTFSGKPVVRVGT